MVQDRTEVSFINGSHIYGLSIGTKIGRRYELSHNTTDFGTNCVKVAEAKPIQSATKCSSGSYSFCR